jgi:AcrR family transcriptional regulator
MSTSELPEATMRTRAQSPGATGPTARERILAEAFALFYSDGIRAVGVDLLIARSAVAKATFYRHFPSKTVLVENYVELRRQTLLGWLAASVAERSVSPAGRLLAVFDVLAELFADPAYRGCPVHNAVVEVGADSPAVLELARSHQGDLEQYLAELAAETGLPAPEEIAARWVLLMDGAFAGAQRTGDATPAAVARRAAEELLAEAVSPTVS